VAHIWRWEVFANARDPVFGKAERKEHSQMPLPLYSPFIIATSIKVQTDKNHAASEEIVK
jgi:hypothetical protein